MAQQPRPTREDVGIVAAGSRVKAPGSFFAAHQCSHRARAMERRDKDTDERKVSTRTSLSTYVSRHRADAFGGSDCCNKWMGARAGGRQHSGEVTRAGRLR